MTADEGRFEIIMKDDYFHMILIGTVTPGFIERFRTEAKIFSKEGIRDLVVDLGKLKTITSLGIGFLVSMGVSAGQRGSKVVAASENGFVTKVLKVAKIDRILHLADSMGSALEIPNQRSSNE